MYVLIVGGGNTGEALAKMLIAEKNDVALVEKDEKRAEELANKLDALIIKGDGSKLEILKDAGIEKADSLAALTDDDNANLTICQIAKNNKVKKVTARVSDPNDESLFVQAGVDAAISTTSAVITSFKNAIGAGDAKALMILANGKLELLEIYVPKDSPAIGKLIKDCEIHEAAKIMSIERGEEVIIPTEDTVLKEGDILLVVSKSAVVHKLFKLLLKEEKEEKEEEEE